MQVFAKSAKVSILSLRLNPNRYLYAAKQSSSNKAFQENVKREIAAGKSQKQALAIAYKTQRENDSCLVKTNLITAIKSALDCIG